MRSLGSGNHLLKRCCVGCNGCLGAREFRKDGSLLALYNGPKKGVTWFLLNGATRRSGFECALGRNEGNGGIAGFGFLGLSIDFGLRFGELPEPAVDISLQTAATLRAKIKEDDLTFGGINNDLE